MSNTVMLETLYDTPVFIIDSRNPQWKDAYGATFIRQFGSWCFPAFRPVYELVIKDLKAIDSSITFSDKATKHINNLNTEISLPKDFSFITDPYQHQIEGLTHLLSYPRAGLFYSPGLGKCKIVIDMLRCVGVPALILCPKVMLTTWAEEFQKHGNINHTLIIDGTKKKKIKLIEQAKETLPLATVVTFDTAARYSTELFGIPYKCIVADESHRLKSPFSNRTKAAHYLASKAYRRVLLSGTPSLGSPFDMYSQLRFLGKYFCPEDWWKFRKKFGVYPPWERNEAVPKILIGYQNVHIMSSRVNLVCARKTKEECLDLPTQHILDKPFGLHHAQKKKYNTLVSERADEVGSVYLTQKQEGELNYHSGPHLAPHVMASETITLLGKLDQISSGFLHLSTKNPSLCDLCPRVNFCAENKILPYTSECTVVDKSPPVKVEKLKKNRRLDLCAELVEDILEDASNKAIIWATYKAEMDDLCTLATKLNIKYAHVRGGLSRNDTDKEIKKFNEDPDCRLYIGQVSTGVGITLNAANYVIYYSLPWSLDHYLQSLDRNYRVGQTRKVTVYRLIASHTLDEAKAAALDQKIKLDQLVTTSTPCLTCSDFVKRCSKYNIKLYDESCKYDRTMMRNTAEVSPIP